MITIKPIHFYNFIKNVEKYLKGKDVETFVDNSYRTKIDGRLKYICENLYTKHQNKHFTMRQYCFYILNMLLCSSDEILFKPSEWELEQISNIGELFEISRLKKDRETIKQILEKLNLETDDKLFNINSNGESIIVDFLLKKYISPIYIMRYMSKFVHDGTESDQHKRVRRLLDAMIKIQIQKTI